MISALLLFPNLGDIYLWTDETDTAAIGRNVMTFGYPVMDDGRNLIQYYPPVYNEQYVEVVLPWLQYYVTAASFAVFGISTTTARVPFTVLGLVGILLFPSVVRRLTADRWVQGVTPLVLATSVPFLLYLRQCRYYALLVVATMWLVWAYLALAEQRRGAAVHLTLAAIVLFHSHYVVCLGTLVGIGFHWLVVYRTRIRWTTVVGMGISFAVFTIPWMLYTRFWTHPYGWFSVQKVLLYIGKLTARLSDDFAPPLLLIVLSWLLLDRSSRFWRTVWLIGGVCAAGVVLNVPGTVYGVTGCVGLALLRWSIRVIRHRAPVAPLNLVWMLPCGVVVTLALFSPSDEVRYLVGLVPFVYLGLIVAFRRVHTRFPRLGTGLLAVFLGTNLFRVIPALGLSVLPTTAMELGTVLYESEWAIRLGLPRVLPVERQWFHRMAVLDEAVTQRAVVQSYLWEYIYELTHEYDGPIEGMTTYLLQHGTREDTVKIDYDAVSLIFYTDMRIIPEHQFQDETIQADWLILRHANWHRVPDAFTERLRQHYDQIVLPYPDLPWENRPELSYHRFKIPHPWPPVVLYRRRDAGRQG